MNPGFAAKKMVGKSKKKRISPIRNAMLAKVHIAKKDMGLDDDIYRMILMDEFGVESAADLKDEELSRLIERFKSRGWRPKAGNDSRKKKVAALRKRIAEEVQFAGFNEKRLRGLVRKICGVADLRFCNDPKGLEHLLRVIRAIVERGE